MDLIKALKDNVRTSMGRTAPKQEPQLDFSPRSPSSAAKRSLAEVEATSRPTSQLVKQASTARMSTGAGAVVGEVAWVPDASGKGMVPQVRPAEEESEAALHAKQVIEEAIRKEQVKLGEQR